MTATLMVSDITASVTFYGKTDQAEYFAGIFPKSYRAKINQCITKGMRIVTINAYLTADKANGGKNESGIKRINNVISKIEAAGIGIDYKAPFPSSYPTIEEALESLS